MEPISVEGLGPDGGPPYDMREGGVKHGAPPFCVHCPSGGRVEARRSPFCALPERRVDAFAWLPSFSCSDIHLSSNCARGSVKVEARCSHPVECKQLPLRTVRGCLTDARREVSGRSGDAMVAPLVDAMIAPASLYGASVEGLGPGAERLSSRTHQCRRTRS